MLRNVRSCRSFFFNRVIGKNFLLTSSAALTFCIYQCVDQKAFEVVRKMKDVQLGMHQEQVIQRLGEPHRISEYEKDNTSYVVMYYKVPDDSDSDTPHITVCKETGLVIEVIDGDHGINDKRIESPSPCSTAPPLIP